MKIQELPSTVALALEEGKTYSQGHHNKISGDIGFKSDVWWREG